MNRPWYACEEPERPPDPYVLWHYATTDVVCSGCSVKIAAAQRIYPDDEHVGWVAEMVAGPN